MYRATAELHVPASEVDAAVDEAAVADAVVINAEAVSSFAFRAGSAQTRASKLTTATRGLVNIFDQLVIKLIVLRKLRGIQYRSDCYGVANFECGL